MTQARADLFDALVIAPVGPDVAARAHAQWSLTVDEGAALDRWAARAAIAPASTMPTRWSAAVARMKPPA